MANDFDFESSPSSGLDFEFGQSGEFNDFNFTDPDYVVPSSLSFHFNEVYIPDIYYVLKGTSNNFNSIWVYNNKMYASTNDTLNVVDLDTNTVYDWYSQTHIGRANESLNNDDALDINAVG